VAIKLKIPKSKSRPAGKGFFSKDPILRGALLFFVVLTVLFVGVFSFFWVK